MNDADLVAGLERGSVAAIQQLVARVQPPIAVVSLDIYPWHTYLAMSIRDASESTHGSESPADWKYFEAASSFDSGVGAVIIREWEAVAEAMSDAWTAADSAEAGAVVADRLHRLAADALTSPLVREALDAAGWGDAELQVINVDDPARRNYASG